MEKDKTFGSIRKTKSGILYTDICGILTSWDQQILPVCKTKGSLTTVLFYRQLLAHKNKTLPQLYICV